MYSNEATFMMTTACSPTKQEIFTVILLQKFAPVVHFLSVYGYTGHCSCSKEVHGEGPRRGALHCCGPLQEAVMELAT